MTVLVRDDRKCQKLEIETAVLAIREVVAVGTGGDRQQSNRLAVISDRASVASSSPCNPRLLSIWS